MHVLSTPPCYQQFEYMHLCTRHHIEEKLCPEKIFNIYLSFFFYEKLCNTYLVGVSVIFCVAAGITQTLRAWACGRVCYGISRCKLYLLMMFAKLTSQPSVHIRSSVGPNVHVHTTFADHGISSGSV